MLLVLCMVLSIMPMTALAAGTENAEKPIVYVSIGDSMTNGYCLDGYDGTSGAVNYGVDTYGNKFAAWLAGYTGSITNDQVIFKGTNGTVDHRQLSISGLRSQDIHWILQMDYTDETLMKNIFSMDYNDSGWNADKWYGWGLYGDRYTWSEYGDYDYRYADAAARILAMYHGGNGTGYFTSSYTDDATVQKAISGIKADPYYPQGKSQAKEMGEHKYLQVATEFYQKSMADADIISLAVGNTNFGTHMLSNITDVIMGDDMSFSTEYSIDKAKALAAEDSFAKAKVDAMLSSKDFADIVAACKYLADGDAAKETEIGYIVEYCMISFITGYVGMLNSILELNPDAEIIQIALMNAYENKDGTVEPNTLGALVDLIYTPVNKLLKALPADLMASKTEEDQAKYAEAKFYFAEAPYVSCMVDVFGDDYYSKDGSFVEYPGLLTGTEGYTANKSSIVRDRFVEEIICGDMIFNAMGLRKQDTQENMRNFLYGGKVYNDDGSEAYEGVGAVAYDMMTLTDKASYAAQNAGAAKEYALYLAFENSLIRSGTENVTMDALAGLADIKNAFLAFYPEVLAAIGNARADYYEAAAPVIVAGSNGALTEEQVVSIMAAYEEMKAAVWNGFADYHSALKSATGHTTLEHVLNCSTCMDDGGHGDGVSEQIVKTYNEQLDLLPYSIVAKMAENQTGGLLDGADIKRLCEAADYEAEVYTLVAEKSDGALTKEQVKTLVATEDGVWIVADELTGGEYGASTIKMAYEKGWLDAEQEEQIELLITVREAVLALLAKDDEGNFTNKDKFSSSAAGIRSAIDNAASLAYLLALPQAMSDTLFNDSDMQGALCMNARCLLGTGAGGHPSLGGHNALYNAVLDAYAHITYEWSEDYSTCTATINDKITAEGTVTSEVTTPATCKTMGTTTYTAEFDVTWAQTQTKAVQNIPTTDHSYEAVVTAPTCTEDGYTTYTCAGCGNSYVDDTVTATGHTYEAVVTVPTCTTAGYTTYTCACGDSYVGDEVEALGHTEVIDNAVAATCTTDGLTEGSHCSVCETVIVAQETVPASGHTWDEGTITKHPTEKETGIKVYTCTACDETKEEEIPVLEPGEVVITRISGKDRFKTSLAAADELKAALGVESFQTIILASGENFADALTGSYLAAVKTAPILLHGDKVVEDNITYITKNLAKNGTVYILGGTSSVSETVEQLLKDEGITVIRLAGKDRFETNLKILEEAGVGEKEILVCTADTFADSLSASAVGLPILLVNNNTQELTKAQAEFLGKLEDNKITIVGGVNSVSEKLEKTLADYGTVSRIAGASREETSVLVAEAYFEAPECLVLADSRNYPDGLCGGCLAFALKAPLVLTASGTEEITAEYVQELTLEKAIVLGGSASVSDVSVEIIFAEN